MEPYSFITMLDEEGEHLRCDKARKELLSNQQALATPTGFTPTKQYPLGFIGIDEKFVLVEDAVMHTV